MLNQVDHVEHKRVRIVSSRGEVHRIVIHINNVSVIKRKDFNLVCNNILVANLQNLVDFDVVKELRHLNLSVRDHLLLYYLLFIWL